MYFAPSRAVALIVASYAGLGLAACASEAAPDPAAKSALAPVVAPGPNPSASKATSTVSPAASVCVEVCNKTSSLHCKAEPDCARDCAEMTRAAAACASAMNGFMSCLSTQPLTNFECGPDGVAGIKRGFCGAEQDAAATCMVVNRPRPQ